MCATQNRIFLWVRSFLLTGKLYPFLSILNLLKLAKMRTSNGFSMQDILIPYVRFCVAAIGVRVFRALTSVDALFMFAKSEEMT